MYGTTTDDNTTNTVSNTIWFGIELITVLVFFSYKINKAKTACSW